MKPEQLQAGLEPDGSLIVYLTPDEKSKGKFFPATGVAEVLTQVVKLLRALEKRPAGKRATGWLVGSLSRDEATGRLMFHLVPGGDDRMPVTREHVWPSGSTAAM